MSDNTTKIIKNVIRDRMDARLNYIRFNDFMSHMWMSRVFVCGNSCNAAKPNDYDVYLTPEESKEFFENYERCVKDATDIKIVSQSKNCVTFIYKETHAIQVCSYTKNTLQEMVDSFDFSYCRVGVEVRLNEDDWLKIEDVITSDYIGYLASGTTEYINSAYPISSMVRVVKTNEKGLFNNRSYIRSILTILRDIMKRGVSDYKDFKDQLDAVDLMIAPVELKGMEEDIKELYALLRHCHKRRSYIVDEHEEFSLLCAEYAKYEAELVEEVDLED